MGSSRRGGTAPGGVPDDGDLKQRPPCEHDRDILSPKSNPLRPPGRRPADGEAVLVMRIPQTLRSLLPACILGLIWAEPMGTLAAPPDAPDRPAGTSRPVDYARDVRPILETRCYACHGPQKQK